MKVMTLEPSPEKADTVIEVAMDRGVEENPHGVDVVGEAQPKSMAVEVFGT